jgi:hypothetical protein
MFYTSHFLFVNGKRGGDASHYNQFYITGHATETGWKLPGRCCVCCLQIKDMGPPRSRSPTDGQQQSLCGRALAVWFINFGFVYQYPLFLSRRSAPTSHSYTPSLISWRMSLFIYACTRAFRTSSIGRRGLRTAFPELPFLASARTALVIRFLY